MGHRLSRRRSIKYEITEPAANEPRNEKIKTPNWVEVIAGT
jgi:hypothetical protein